MKSSYKALATYIEPVNQLNDGMEVKELLGISNQKFFQNGVWFQRQSEQCSESTYVLQPISKKAKFRKGGT